MTQCETQSETQSVTQCETQSLCHSNPARQTAILIERIFSGHKESAKSLSRPTILIEIALVQRRFVFHTVRIVELISAAFQFLFDPLDLVLLRLLDLHDHFPDG